MGLKLKRKAKQPVIPEESPNSLKAKFGEQRKEEIVVDRPFAVLLAKIWNLLATLIGGILALIGLYALLNPEIRETLFGFFLEFYLQLTGKM